MNRDFDTIKNYDDVYFRDLYSAMSYFFFDTISIKKVTNNSISEIKVPVSPSFGADEQFTKDFFINAREKCNGFPIVESLTNTTPSGRITMDEGFNIDTSSIIDNGIRTRRLELSSSNDFFDNYEEKFARRTILTITGKILIQYRCNSVLERFKIVEEILHFFYKTRMYYFSSQGIKKIPCLISLTDSINTQVNRQFTFGQDNNSRPTLDINYDYMTYLVLKNERNKLSERNLVDNAAININTE